MTDLEDIVENNYFEDTGRDNYFVVGSFDKLD